ncbi:hypothetical protein EVAR_17091_1 [Eumeta japonica]|uniref:Uncharacterized protein n=1 Tax=Eumeta variegata TaxID=151549 RepID=A0A4C1V4L9_EUMVA|nr:hypothetical protein EVAR_17091_1 [Eumeta japonica]
MTQQDKITSSKSRGEPRHRVRKVHLLRHIISSRMLLDFRHTNGMCARIPCVCGRRSLLGVAPAPNYAFRMCFVSELLLIS